MRVLQIANWYIPEYGYQEYFLADAWQRMGHEVVTVAGTHVYPGMGYTGLVKAGKDRKVSPGRYQEYGTDVWRLSCLEMRHRTFLSAKLESLVREFEPDRVLVHSLTTLNCLRMAFLKSKMAKQFYLICDDHLISSNVQSGIKGGLFYRIFRGVVTPRLLRSVDAFVPISIETRDIMFERCGIPLDRMTVIPLGVEAERFQRNYAERTKIRKRLNVSADEVLIVYAGKLQISKRIDVLIEAVLRVIQTDSAVKVLVIGDGDSSYVDEQKRKVEKAGFGTRVIWMPLIPNVELPGYFSAADLGIWPGTESMVMLEAAACEVPIICRDSPYHIERFGDGAGCLFHDFEGLMHHLVSLTSNPALRRRTGIRAMESVRHCSWDLVAARFLDV